MSKTKKKRLGATGVLVLLALSAVVVAASHWLRPDIEKLFFPQKYAKIVSQQAEQFGLEENLVYAVIKAESNFNPEAVSAAGAEGLMQLMPETYRWICQREGYADPEEAIQNPETNIRCGCALLRLLLDMYGEESTALCAYNAGMGNVTSWLSDPQYSADGRTLSVIPFQETEHYVQKVLQYKNTYDTIYGRK